MSKADQLHDYHTAKLLKGLQDDFDESKSPERRVEIAKAMQLLLDGMTYREDMKKR